jgi:hypothetical protein
MLVRTGRSASARWTVIGLAVVASGCGSSPATTPTPVPAVQQPSPSGFSVSGVVYQSRPDGLMPLAGVALDISAEDHSFPPVATSDANGRFHLAGLQSQPLNIRASKSSYSQPCSARFTPIADTVLDVYIVSNTVLETTGLPPATPTTHRRSRARSTSGFRTGPRKQFPAPRSSPTSAAVMAGRRAPRLCPTGAEAISGVV